MKNKLTQEGWRGFLKLCTKTKKEEDLNALFDLFLTMEEKDALATRYLLVKALLEEKKPQRDIAEDLKISISKITRGSNALKLISRQLRDFLKTQMR